MDARTRIVLSGLVAVFCLLAVAFSLDLWGRPEAPREIPPVDPSVLDTETWRRSYADLLAADEDVSYFDCYLCHEDDKESVLTLDENGRVVLPEEHEDIKMAHGSHARTNNCFNCHDSKKLTQLQALDGRELTFENSSQLCGSCHQQTFSDWVDGSHGRMTGHWDRSAGKVSTSACVNCHDPHAPAFPGRAPAPGPNYLRAKTESTEAKEDDH